MTQKHMKNSGSGDIWVFGDLRNRRLFDLSCRVLSKAVALTRHMDAKAVMLFLTPPEDIANSADQKDACAVMDSAGEKAVAKGADTVFFLENNKFSWPSPHLFAPAVAEFVKDRSPRLLLFALTGFGRELAARTSAINKAGLMADCMDILMNEDGSIKGLCPAWGGEIMAEITYDQAYGTGLATVRPHGFTISKTPGDPGHIEHIAAHVKDSNRIRLVSSVVDQGQANSLEDADIVVVGGAGLGSSEGFGRIRDLAAAVGGQVGATRPPVLDHWVDEKRLIGQTGKTVRPKLLFSVGTSGAIQYTAGIMEAETIVAVNRDPEASIFQVADVGIVADVNAFLPVFSARIRQTVMRKLADVLCEKQQIKTGKSSFGEKIKSLRIARDWSVEKMAGATGQTPEFIRRVEAGKLSPPVSFLVRLAGAVDVDPGTFLKSGEKTKLRNQRNRAYIKRTSSYSYQTLTSGAQNDHLRAFMVTIEPHGIHKPVAYKHEGEEFIFIMKGELEFTLGKKMYCLKKGESIHFNSDIPHKLKSLSGETTRCLVILYTL